MLRPYIEARGSLHKSGSVAEGCLDNKSCHGEMIKNDRLKQKSFEGTNSSRPESSFEPWSVLS